MGVRKSVQQEKKTEPRKKTARAATALRAVRAWPGRWWAERLLAAAGLENGSHEPKKKKNADRVSIIFSSAPRTGTSDDRPGLAMLLAGRLAGSGDWHAVAHRAQGRRL